MWKLKIPPKVKDMLWRAISGCLPTRIQLGLKHVEVPSSCPRCHNAAETISHCLVGCSFAVTCWRVADVSIMEIGNYSFGGWFLENFKNWNLEMIKLAAMLCWAIWRARNDKVWKDRNSSVFEVVALAKCNLDQWSCAQDKSTVSSLFSLQPGEGNEHWTAPGENTIKVNVEAAIFEENNMYGYGWVARDNLGRFIEARTGSRMGRVDPGFAEALGVKEVLSWIKETGAQDVTVETDSLVTIQAIRSSVRMTSVFGYCIDECKDIISNLHNVGLCFVKRSANRAAHHLARVSRLNAGCSYSVATAPNDFLDVIHAEMV